MPVSEIQTALRPNRIPAGLLWKLSVSDGIKHLSRTDSRHPEIIYWHPWESVR